MTTVSANRLKEETHWGANAASVLWLIAVVSAIFGTGAYFFLAWLLMKHVPIQAFAIVELGGVLQAPARVAIVFSTWYVPRRVLLLAVTVVLLYLLGAFGATTMRAPIRIALPTLVSVVFATLGLIAVILSALVVVAMHPPLYEVLNR